VFDVGIVGAGPSGSWAAYLLARMGARVAVADASHPREKPCGGGVTRRALAVVGSALPSGGEVIAMRSARFVDVAGARQHEVALDGSSASGLVVTSRRDFDRRLLDLAIGAGAEHVRARVVDVTRRSHGYWIRTGSGRTLGARLLVGADGVTSLVRRRLARPFRRDQLSIATGFFAHGVTDQSIVIEFTRDPPGYIWSFPRPDHLAVGVCAQADTGVGSGWLRAQTAGWMQATGIGAGARWEPYAWPIPSLNARDLETLTTAGDDWCLLGDAAGLVDPLTREGIYFALRSAMLAAEAIGAGDLGLFDARVRAELVTELRRAARLKAGFFTPHFTGLVLDALADRPAIRRVMAELITGELTYRRLPWRLLATGDVRLAGRLALVKARSSRLWRAPGFPGA
jgi:geranylgeranyl reductase family protein